jgi:ankyrin repeat protein
MDASDLGYPLGQAGVVKLLLDKGANVGAKDQLNHTAPSLATQYGHADVIKLLSAASAVAHLNEQGLELMQGRST